jgi:hypothetical protein
LSCHTGCWQTLGFYHLRALTVKLFRRDFTYKPGCAKDVVKLDSIQVHFCDFACQRPALQYGDALMRLFIFENRVKERGITRIMPDAQQDMLAVLIPQVPARRVCVYIS